MAKKGFGCERPECHASSFEGMATFGTGKLDEYGFWEYPCPICKKAWDEIAKRNTIADIKKEA